MQARRDPAAPPHRRPQLERDLDLRPLPHRSIQIGLGDPAGGAYVDEWILNITDVTDRFRRVSNAIQRGCPDEARSMLSTESPYPLDTSIAATIGATAAAR